MIIETESEIKALRRFCGSPFEYFSIAETGERAEISRNWAYRIIRKFEGHSVLEKSGKKCKLDFSNPFCKRLKLLFDSEHVLSLDPGTMSRVSSMTDKIIYETNPESIVLVGSAASGKQRKESDLDFLVVGGGKKMPHFENCNLVALTEQDFKEKYLKGDDFIISALLFGKVVYDRGFFMKFFESPLPIFSQEIIQEKIRYCETLEGRIYALLKTDEEKAREELVHLALQAGRIILLRKKIVPKSKYDISGQVRPYNTEIAGIAEDLLGSKRMAKQKILDYLKVCMDSIS